MGVNPKMVGKPQQTHGVFLLEMIMTWGVWGVPLFKETPISSYHAISFLGLGIPTQCGRVSIRDHQTFAILTVGDQLISYETPRGCKS